MKMNRFLAVSLLPTLFLAPQVYAFQFDKPMSVPVVVTKSSAGLRAGISEKNVTIMRVHLSEKEKQGLAHRVITPSIADSHLPARIEIGMNDVPVLNQGMHGSCVTFAVSAAIDAVLGKGDYISQLCNLELGNHLEKYGYVFSGWEGSYGPIVLNQIMHFGVISKETQTNQSCADVKDYPLYEPKNTGNEMSLSQFANASENLNGKLYWKHLYSNDQLFDWDNGAPNEMEKVLHEVKANLVKGNRSTVGTFLIIPNSPLRKCHAGACASRNQPNDTWALSKELENLPYEVAGHELVVTGYDDEAIATDKDGRQHRGLLTLRNSWGDDSGDNGNYYMSYDFFKKYVNEVQVIIELKH